MRNEAVGTLKTESPEFFHVVQFAAILKDLKYF